MFSSRNCQIFLEGCFNVGSHGEVHHVRRNLMKHCMALATSESFGANPRLAKRERFSIRFLWGRTVTDLGYVQSLASTCMFYCKDTFPFRCWNLSICAKPVNNLSLPSSELRSCYNIIGDGFFFSDAISGFSLFLC